MKNLITYLKTLWSRVADSQSTDVSLDCRFTVGRPSGLGGNSLLKLVSVLVLILTIGSGNAWGEEIELTTGSLGTDGGYHDGAEQDATISTVDFKYVNLMTGTGGNAGNIQVKASTGEWWNTSIVPGKITNVTATHSGTSRTGLLYWGTSAKTTSNSTNANGSFNCNSPTGCFGYVHYIRNSGSAAYWSQIVITYTPATITLSENSISGFDYNVGGGPSASQTFTVSGSNIPANLVVKAPTNFEVKVGNGSWGSSGTITVTTSGSTGGQLSSTTVYVRLASGKAAGNYSGNVSIKIDGANDKSGTTPKTVAVSGTVSAGSVAVTGVTVDPTSKSIVPGQTFDITPTISPSNATDKVVSWTSDPTTYATVSNGTVTGVAAGSSTITCTTHDGDYTATCTVTVRAVTMQARDEDGYAIAGGGPGAPTRSGASIAPAADAGNYVFKEWQITNASLGSSASTKSNTITNPTGAVTVTAVYYKPITITYKANNQVFTTQTYSYGGTLAFPVSNPTPGTYSCDGKTFVGWVGEANKDYSHASIAPTYATAGGSVTAAATYYAVFATAGGGGTTTKTDEFTYTSFFNACTSSGANTNGAYTDFSSKSGSESDAVYAGNVFKHGNGPANCKDFIQMRTTNSNTGIITTTSGGKAKKVTVEWNSTTANAKVVNIYGKSTAYSAASDLFNDATDGDLLGTITKGTSTEYTITGDYEYIGIRSNDGSVYFDAISIDWQTGGGVTYSDYTTSCVSTRTIYLDAYHFGDSDGAKFAIYSWKNGSDPLDDKLADAFMTKETDCALPHLYVGEYPDNHDRIIFLRNAAAAASPVKSGANKLNQTSNITTDADKDLFTIASGGGGDTYSGSWSVYTKSYAVTFDKNGVTSTSTWPSDQCIAEGGKVTDPNITPLAMGKTFVGWYQEAGGVNAWVFNTNTVSAATTIYAKWNDVATKTIYLDASATLDGGNRWDADNVVLFARAYINGTSLGTNVTPDGDGPISSCQPHVYKFTIPGNANYVSFARCTAGTTELPSDWDAQGTPIHNSIRGKEIVANKDHYVVDGWGSATLQNSAFTPTSYTISFAAGDYGSGDAPANDSKACGVTYVLPNSQVFSRNGYTMDGWSVNANGSTKDYNLGGNYTTDADQTFYPHWALASYGVTLNTNGGTINAGNVTTYTYGTGATLPTDVTKSHATFQGWYAASNFSGDRVYTIGTTEYGDKEYWAKWETITWTVTWKVKGETVRTDASVTDGDKVASLPSAPSDLTTGSDGCDAEFVGWVIEANDPGALSISTRDTAPSGIFTNVAGSPAITANTTFVAIYRQEQ